MSDSLATATPETTTAAPAAHLPVRENQIEAEVDRSQVAGQRVMRSIGGGSPAAQPRRFAGALGQMPGSSQVGMMRQLQRSYGNSYAGRVIQAKLTVGQPGDVYEQEADQIADRVMRMPDSPSSKQELSFSAVHTSTAQRESTDEISNTAPPLVHEVLKSSGQPLDPEIRTFMEPRFGHDFSQVRIHTDASAVQSTRELNAHAYTVDNNIVFGADQFAPGTQEGQRLVAHELTHVVQQNRSASPTLIQRQPIPIYHSPKPLLPRSNNLFIVNNGSNVNSSGGTSIYEKYPETYLPFDTSANALNPYLDRTANSFQQIDPNINIEIEQRTAPPVKSPNGKDLKNHVSFLIATEGKGVPGQIKTDTELSAEYDFTNYKWVPVAAEGGKKLDSPLEYGQVKYPVSIKFARTIKYSDDKNRQVIINIYGVVDFTPEQWEQALGFRASKMNPLELLHLGGNWGSYYWRMTGTGSMQKYAFENVTGGDNAPNLLGLPKDQQTQMLRNKAMPSPTFMRPEILPDEQFNGIKNYLDAADKIEMDYQEWLKALPKFDPSAKSGDTDTNMGMLASGSTKDKPDLLDKFDSILSAIWDSFPIWFRATLKAASKFIVLTAIVLLLAEATVLGAALLQISLVFSSVVYAIGGILMAATFFYSIWNRSIESFSMSSGNPLTIFLSALGDTFGISQIIEATTNKSILSGTSLNLDEEDRWEMGVGGAIQLLGLLMGFRSRVKGRRPIGDLLPEKHTPTEVPKVEGLVAETPKIEEPIVELSKQLEPPKVTEPTKASKVQELMESQEMEKVPTPPEAEPVKKISKDKPKKAKKQTKKEILKREALAKEKETLIEKGAAIAADLEENGKVLIELNRQKSDQGSSASLENKIEEERIDIRENKIHQMMNKEAIAINYMKIVEARKSFAEKVSNAVDKDPKYKKIQGKAQTERVDKVSNRKIEAGESIAVDHRVSRDEVSNIPGLESLEPEVVAEVLNMDGNTVPMLGPANASKGNRSWSVMNDSNRQVWNEAKNYYTEAEIIKQAILENDMRAKIMAEIAKLLKGLR
jgi:Domain of unknown function (DUF4157)